MIPSGIWEIYSEFLIFCNLFHEPFNRGIYRSSRLKVFCGKGVLKDFAKLTGKHLCRSLLSLRPATLLTLICINWVPGDPRTIFLVTSFTRKMPESSDSMYFSIFMLENI